MLNQSLKDFILLFIILFLVDIIFITYFLGPIFGKMIKNIQGSPMTVKKIPAAFAWFSTVAILYYFIIRENKNEKDAAILGFLSYGIYEGTNYAIIKNWSFHAFLLDIIWGATLFYTSTILFKKIKKIL